MRLAKLELLAYGPFRGLALDFSAPGVHVVLGRNEAGKSTTLRAITGLLYGIDPKTADAHVHKFGDLRIGGVLESASRERIRVIRRKGNTNTLLDEREQSIDESVIKKLLAGVSKETFVHAFGLDHDTLEAGAKALLEGRGDLGESLFDASVGGGGEVQRLLADLVAEADAIYKPRATALPLNDALKAFADAQKTVRERQSLPEAFLAQEAGLEEAGRELSTSIAQKSEIVSRRALLARARQRVPLERRYERARRLRTELGLLAGQVPRVEGLRDRFVAYERALDQSRAHIAEVERLADRVAEAARRAGVDPGATTDAVRLDARKEARVHSLLGERTELTQRLESARAEILRDERELGRLMAVAAPGGEATDLPDAEGRWDALALALERARALGDVEARIATEKSRIDRRRKDLETRAVALGLFEGSLEALIALPLPAVASVERLESRAAEIGRTIARIEERTLDLERDAASLDKQTAGHTGDFAPPDAAELSTARTARDDAWKIARATKDGSARAPLEVEVERLLRAADSLADRMIRDADRVTTLARLRSETEANARQREKLAEDKACALRDRATLDTELIALFSDAKLRPLDHSAMRQWLGRHLEIAGLYSALRDAEAGVLEEDVKVARAMADLRAALGELVAVGEPHGVSDLIAIGTRRMASMEASRRAIEEAARATASIHAKLDERISARDQDEAKLADASAKLTELLAPLGIPGDASADEVNRSIEAVRELFSLVETRANSEARARVADADVRVFEADLGRAIADLAPHLSSAAPRDAAPALFALAVEARDNAQELATVEAQLAEIEGDAPPDAASLALASDPEAASRAHLEMEAQLEEIEREISRLNRTIGGTMVGMEKMRAESHAAEAAALAQQHLARVRENVERWCRAKLAAVLLSREIERYREENQAPLLASSSSLFSRLTLGAFSGIKAGFDDKDRPCLRCVRAAGTTEVDVMGLSDGTRDQLYLSLRLASLLRRADVAEPMPLVLDDVLIQLDDQRASAALAVLAEVAQRMQVLFFTHHARLVDLARAAIPAGELFVHELTSGLAQPPEAAAASVTHTA